MGCVFCGIVRGEERASVVHEDDVCVAFMDLFPIRSGHVLVVPRAHAVHLHELPEAVRAHLFVVATRIMEAQRAAGIGWQGGNVLVNDGRRRGSTSRTCTSTPSPAPAATPSAWPGGWCCAPSASSASPATGAASTASRTRSARIFRRRPARQIASRTGAIEIPRPVSERDEARRRSSAGGLRQSMAIRSSRSGCGRGSTAARQLANGITGATAKSLGGGRGPPRGCVNTPARTTGSLARAPRAGNKSVGRGWTRLRRSVSRPMVDRAPLRLKPCPTWNHQPHRSVSGKAFRGASRRVRPPVGRGCTRLRRSASRPMVGSRAVAVEALPARNRRPHRRLYGKAFRRSSGCVHAPARGAAAATPPGPQRPEARTVVSVADRKPADRERSAGRRCGTLRGARVTRPACR